MRTARSRVFVAAVTISLLARAASPASAAETAAFARLTAPVKNGWTPPGRWKDQTIDGQAVCRLVADTAYCRAKVLTELPTAGHVMIKVRYYSRGDDAFRIGLGAWGSPVKEITPQGTGWQTGKVAFPAYALRRDLNDAGVGMMVKKSTATGPALAGIELYVPTRQEVLECFRRYVRQATARAWKMGRSPGLTYISDYDDAEPLAPSAEDRRRGAIPFLRSYLKYIYPASVPVKSERVLRGRVRMTPGEYEPFQFGLKALKDLPRCGARLVGRLPEGLSAEICWVECVPTRTRGGSRSKKWHVQPYRLWPPEIFPTCDVKANDAQAWWIILKADEQLAPGTYPLKLAIESAGQDVLTYRLEVEVLPFKLPKRIPRAFLICEATMVRDEALLKDLAEHGCNGLNAFNSFMPIKAGKVDFATWDAYFATLKRYGLDYCFFWYLGNPRSGNAVLKSVGKEKFIQILKGLNQRVQDGRYPKIFALTIDEAVTSSRAFNDFKRLSAMLRRYAPALKCQGTSLASHRYARRYQGLIDILACNGSFGPNSAWCRQNNVTFTIYGYVAARVSANHTRSTYGFNAWRYGAEGVNGWALRWYNGNPFNDLDAGVSDWGILLPNWLGKPISTPAWEGYREGVDDQRYLYLLEQLVRQGKASDALLKEIRQKGIGEMKVWAEKVVGDSLFGVALKDAGDLQIARERVIREILKAKGLK